MQRYKYKYMYMYKIQAHLRTKGRYFEDTLDGEHGREDEVEVGEHIGELEGGPLELENNS